MLFFSASPVEVKRCMLSSKAPILARFSSLNTVPMAWASLPISRHAALPASISGFSSLALSPNSSMASASRSAPASMLCSESMASQNTSSVLRMLPSKSWMDTPSFTKFWYAAPLESAKPSAMCLDRSFMLSLTRSTEVSMKLLA